MGNSGLSLGPRCPVSTFAGRNQHIQLDKAKLDDHYHETTGVLQQSGHPLPCETVCSFLFSLSRRVQPVPLALLMHDHSTVLYCHLLRFVCSDSLVVFYHALRQYLSAPGYYATGPC